MPKMPARFKTLEELEEGIMASKPGGQPLVRPPQAPAPKEHAHAGDPCLPPLCGFSRQCFALVVQAMSHQTHPRQNPLIDESPHPGLYQWVWEEIWASQPRIFSLAIFSSPFLLSPLSLGG